MPGATQAPVGGRALALRFSGRATLVSLLLFFAGCTTGVLDLGQSGIDRSLVTGSIPAISSESLPLPEIAGMSAIVVTLSGAVGEGGATTPLAWEDHDNGVRGTVTHIAGGPGDACRDFITTRESFDGVHLYRGQLCNDEAAGWQMRSFEPL